MQLIIVFCFESNFTAPYFGKNGLSNSDVICFLIEFKAFSSTILVLYNALSGNASCFITDVVCSGPKFSVYTSCLSDGSVKKAKKRCLTHYCLYMFDLKSSFCCINSLCVASLPTASEAGLCPPTRLGSLPHEAPWRTLQEHDRPSGNQLPGPQTAPQGLPARVLPVAVTSVAPHPPTPSPA